MKVFKPRKMFVGKIVFKKFFYRNFNFIDKKSHRKTQGNVDKKIHTNKPTKKNQ